MDSRGLRADRLPTRPIGSSPMIAVPHLNHWRVTMSDQSQNDAAGRFGGAGAGPGRTVHGDHADASRRSFLTGGAALAAGGAASATFNDGARAQQANAAANAAANGAGDAEADLRRLMGARRILIKHVTALTVDPRVGDFAAADILIEDGKIRDIRPDIAASPDGTAVIDGTNRIAIPGFVDTHSHSYQGVLRSIMPNGALDPDYNRDVQTRLTPAFMPADVHAGVLMTALGFIDMGTTAIVDLSQISHTPEHSDACIAALNEAGIRAVYGYSRGIGPAAQYPQDIARLRRSYFSGTDQLLTLALGASLDPATFRAAREAGLRAVLHIRNDNDKLLELGRAGLLREGDEFIHCIGLTAQAWRLIRDSGGHVSLCPQIEMSMGHGLPAIQQALDNGVRPSLSSDHGVAVAQDFFFVMRAAFMFQRMQIFARARAGEQGPPALLTCRDALEFATLQGARCAELDARIGTLAPGKDADLLLLRADGLSLWPLNNAAGTVVNLMNPGQVESVFIAGKPKKWRGQLVGVDRARVMRLAAEARDAVMRRAGYSMNFLG
jgi:5-methylthioadenosine/S-adenosylhomocysteine deaminase